MARKRNIAVLLFPSVNALDVAGPVEAFATALDDRGQRAYAIETWALGDKIVRSESGLSLCADRAIPKKPSADILLIPGGEGLREPGTLEPIAAWLKQHAHRIPRIVSVCTGAYALAASGLADGRTLATHWAFADDLQRRYPSVRVNADALFLKDGRFYSSGGVTAGLDLALDLIEQDVGRQAAMGVARQLVVFLRRTGTQAQFSKPLQMQTKAPGQLAEVCQWAASNLDQNLAIEALAGRMGLSVRQFSRRFRESFGESPAAYIKRLRLDTGRTMLAQGLSISQTAHAVGFASQDGFRRAFEDRFGLTPGEYQKRFRQEEVSV